MAVVLDLGAIPRGLYGIPRGKAGVAPLSWKSVSLSELAVKATEVLACLCEKIVT